MMQLHLRSVRLSPVLLLAGLLVSIFGPVSTAPAQARGLRAVPLGSLLPTLTDIKHVYGSGFKVVISRQTKNGDLNAAVPGVAGAAQRQALAGRVTGYVSMYSHQLIAIKGTKVTSKPGVTLVLTGINEYQSADFAHRTMTAALQSKVKPPKGTTEHITPLSGVGDSAVNLSLRTATAGLPVTYSSYIGFQRGKYTAVVDVAAYGGQPSSSTVLALARLLDARIRSKG
jgi:hypothetical protein